jgi:adenylosuccinate synthase
LETFVFSVSLIETKDLGFYAHDGIVFENSQGLGLDWNRGTRPYVTRSNTGLANIIDVCEEAKIAAVEVYYTTRCYLTRHGMGPMENERDKPFKNAVELSNKENEFQGKFRMGQLNVSKVRERIKTDLESFDSKVKVFPNLAITCLDQADDLSKYRVGGTVVSVKRENLAASIAREVGMPCFLESWGPTRDTVKEGFAL